MKLAAHVPLQGGIDELVLLDAREPREGRGYDARAVVVAVAGQILDGDLGVREGLDEVGVQGFDGHGHGVRVLGKP